MRKPHKPTHRRPSTYYPSQERGNQFLVLDDRTVLGSPDRGPRIWGA